MKYPRHTHNQVIERKLEQLPSGDADFLWNDMHSILDKEMPQKKERRRFIAWLLTGKCLFLLSIASIISVTGVSLFYLSNKQSAIENNLPQSQKTNPTIQPSMTIIPEKENKLFTPANTDQTERTNEEETVPSFSSPIDKNVTKNTIVPKQTKDNSICDYIVRNQNDQSIQWQYPDKKIEETGIGIISMTNKTNDQTNFDANAINLTSAQTFLAQMNHTRAAQPRKNIHGHSEKGLYAGIVIGADLTSIHFKSMKTGATKGLLVGYALNEKWSIESGVFWDKKRMYDDGSNFNPPGYTPTSSTRIVAVNGTNRLYEWPVNIKYVIIPQKHSLFVTAGVSSYFMKKENYDYEYIQNNQPGGHNYLSYENETKNWFSVANFSIGYAHKLGATGSIRIEPYLKLPIKNLGVGNMPIMSTGLNIGFTKQLTR
jgi:hypothetical protein